MEEFRTAEEFKTYEIARSIPGPEAFAKLLDDYLNLGGKQATDGLRVGKTLRNTHRTLQRQVVAFCLGVICGISQQEHTDPRNETAIATAKKVCGMVESGELPVGLYL